ncbi:MAG TPA: TadE/TadG family type IV pilus assembly protein [Terriglobales bacterium]|nr:TadE/TadG family type IV pilus assembly protein [Terriglobales bacterium]
MKRNRERGATILEVAISIMLLFTLLIACIEFGRAYNIYQTVTNAAREGARYSVAPLPGTTELPNQSQVDDWVKKFLNGANISGATVSINQTLPGPQVGGVDTVYSEVAVSAPYQFFFFPFGTVSLTSQARMRNETN